MNDTKRNIGKTTSVKDNSVRNSRATLFSFIFSDEKALVDLYDGLGKEVSAEDIEHLSLDDLLQRVERYNDTAFRTKDNRLIVFIEHQFTPNRNMPLRFLEYAVYIMRALDVFAGQNRFGEKLMDLPTIEFYVGYNGRKTIDEADKNLVVSLGDIRVTAKVTDIRFENLPKVKALDKQDFLAGYAYFAKTFDEMRNQGKTPYDAYDATVKKCLEEGYLNDILSRKECVDLFAETYCYDDQLRYEGREEGRMEGREVGREEGLELSTQIFSELMKNVPIPEIAERYGVSTQQIEKLKEAMFALQS